MADMTSWVHPAQQATPYERKATFFFQLGVIFLLLSIIWTVNRCMSDAIAVPRGFLSFVVAKPQDAFSIAQWWGSKGLTTYANVIVFLSTVLFVVGITSVLAITAVWAISSFQNGKRQRLGKLFLWGSTLLGLGELIKLVLFVIYLNTSFKWSLIILLGSAISAFQAVYLLASAVFYAGAAIVSLIAGRRAVVTIVDPVQELAESDTEMADEAREPESSLPPVEKPLQQQIRRPAEDDEDIAMETGGGFNSESDVNSDSEQRDEDGDERVRTDDDDYEEHTDDDGAEEAHTEGEEDALTTPRRQHRHHPDMTPLGGGRRLLRTMPLHRINGLDAANIAKLYAVGIKTVYHLLQRCSSELKRDVVAEETGLDPDDLETWWDLGNLYRIRGYGPVTSHQLEQQAGIMSLEDLAHADINDLQQHLETLGPHTPHGKKLQRFVAQAKFFNSLQHRDRSRPVVRTPHPMRRTHTIKDIIQETEYLLSPKSPSKLLFR